MLNALILFCAIPPLSFAALSSVPDRTRPGRAAFYGAWRAVDGLWTTVRQKLEARVLTTLRTAAAECTLRRSGARPLAKARGRSRSSVVLARGGWRRQPRRPLRRLRAGICDAGTASWRC
jgi:hypothetical protein